MKKYNIYIENGYKNQSDYYLSLSECFNVDLSAVYALSDVLGQSEDFDGLVSSLDDYQYLMNGNALNLN
jgi:hypothetical protein